MQHYINPNFDTFFKDYFKLYYNRPFKGYKASQKELDGYWEQGNYKDSIRHLKRIKSKVSKICMQEMYIPDEHPDLCITLAIKLKEPITFENEEKGLQNHPVLNIFWEELDLSGGECSPMMSISRATNGWVLITMHESY